jgi:hypothetical protein
MSKNNQQVIEEQVNDEGYQWNISSIELNVTIALGAGGDKQTAVETSIGQLGHSHSTLLCCSDVGTLLGTRADACESVTTSLQRKR